jgi:hypothetical protein
LRGPVPGTSARFPKFVCHRGILLSNFGKQRALADLMIAVPLCDLKFLEPMRGHLCRNFRSAALLPATSVSIFSGLFMGQPNIRFW